jgi:hypothetical protein
MATTKDTAPRFRVRFTTDDGRDHDAHVAFRAREDAQVFCEALMALAYVVRVGVVAS